MNHQDWLARIRQAAQEKGFMTFLALNDFLPKDMIEEMVLEQALDQLDQENIPLYNSEREFLHFKRKKKKRPIVQSSPREAKDSVSRYLKHMNHIQRMGEQERQRLIRDIAELYARRQASPSEVDPLITEKQNRLVQGHVRLVVSLARKYINRGVEYSDLIQEGNSGLVKAVRKYHYGSQNNFVPFLIDHIKESLLNAIYRLSGSLALSKGDNRALRKLSNKYDKLEQFVEIIDHDDVKREERILVSKKIKDTMDIKRMRSLDQPVYDGEFSKLSDYLSDESVRSQIETLIQKENTGLVHEKLRALPPQEQQIIILRFGIKSNVYKTWPEIADRMRISVKKAMNLEARALRKLKKLLTPPL